MASGIPAIFATDILYSFILLVCSLMIYWGTKELYDLTSHKGLRYFRQAFLFFGLAYFFRSFVRLFLLFFELPEALELSPRAIGTFALFGFMYFSTMSIFYLLYSVMWKRWKGKHEFLFHILAIIISLVTVFYRTLDVVIAINLILLLFVIFTVYMIRKEKKHGNSLYAVYALLLVFWLFNMFDLLVPVFLGVFQIILYCISSLLFLMMLYKVLRKTGSR